MNSSNNEKEVILKIKESELNEWESSLSKREKSLYLRKIKLKKKGIYLNVQRIIARFWLVSFLLMFVFAILPKPEYKSMPDVQNISPSVVEKPIDVYVDTPLDKCVDKGVAYFQDIGSYPILKAYPEAGRNSYEVVRERCMRSLYAFGNISD